MNEFGGGRPNDERHFVHKTIGKLVGGALSIGGGLIGGPIGGIAKGIGGRLSGRPRQQAVPGRFAVQQFQPVVSQVPTTFQGGGRMQLAAAAAPPGCPPGFTMTARGCERKRGGATGFFQRLIPGGETGFETGFGEASVGQFGAGLEPAIRTTSQRICPRGAVLGIDGLCYNKRDLKNADRFWPKGRAPLLTGGEMRCITIASRAASKIRTKTKQLQKLGMLPKPTRRAPARRQLAAGHHAHVEHD